MGVLYVKGSLLFTLIIFSSVVQQQCLSSRIYAYYPGDILLAAFFPVHGRLGRPQPDGIDPIDHTVCGGIQEEDGLQAMEAFYYALDKINEDPKLTRNFKLGAVVLDSCDDDTHALEQAVDLIRVLMTRDDPNDLPYNTCRCVNGNSVFQNVSGVIGGRSSSISVQLASLLKLFSVPQISYLSTSPDLGQKDRFPYFKRTVPSDSNQAKAIVDILLRFEWTYVSVIYEDSNYGLKGYGELERMASGSGVCFAFTKRIDYDEPTWSDKKYEDIIKAMPHKTRVAVLWADSPRARRLFEAANRLNVTDIIWVGSDAWSGRQVAVEGLHRVVKNSITVQPLVKELEGFDEYFTSLNASTNERNPWFKEFWAKHFDCEWPRDYTTQEDATTEQRTPKESYSPQKFTFNKSKMEAFNPVTQLPQALMTGAKQCTGMEKLGQESGYRQQMNIHFISDAAHAFAQALVNMQNTTARSGETLQAANITGPQLLQYLGNVNFTGASGQQFQFQNDNKIDGPPRYTILSYREISTRAISYTWMPVGEYSAVDGQGTIMTIDPDFEEDVRDTYPSATCGVPCNEQQARIYQKGERCCWSCYNCSDWHIVFRVPEEWGDDVCIKCAKGMEPNSNYTMCQTITPTYMSHHSPWALISMAVALLCFLFAIFTLVVVIIYFNTPVIMASGRELSLVLLGVIHLSYISTFIMVSKPGVLTCSMTRVLMGICYTGIYASILAKASRISRIFNDAAGSPAKKAKLTSPKSQMIILGLLFLVEIIILSVWFAAKPPSTMFTHPSREIRLLICNGSKDASYLIALAYPFVLMLLCLFYAFKTRKTPDGFNETKLIAFTSYTTVVIWMAFVPLYFINYQSIEVRVATLCISLSLNATVALVCLFLPKIYICLFRPEKNTREAVMTRSQSVISSSNMPEQIKVTDGSRRGSRRDSSNTTNNAWKTGVSLDPTAASVNGAVVGQRLGVPTLPNHHHATSRRPRTNSATQTCQHLYDPIYESSRDQKKEKKSREKETSVSKMTEKPNTAVEQWRARDDETHEVTLELSNLEEKDNGREPITKVAYRSISINRLKDLPGLNENLSKT